MHGTVKKVFSFKKMEKITQRNGCVKKPRKEGRKKERQRDQQKKRRERWKKSGSFSLCNKYKVPLQTLNVTKV